MSLVKIFFTASIRSLAVDVERQIGEKVRRIPNYARDLISQSLDYLHHVHQSPPILQI